MASSRPQVSIRLATDGKAQVVRDFAEVGDAGDASAKRLSASYSRAANDADGALARLQRSAERMAAIAPSSSAAMAAINQSTGVSASASVGAKASAMAIQAQMDAADASAKRLMASIDPLFAAQMRYNQALAEAISLQKMGALTEAQLATVQTGLKANLDQQISLMGRNGLATNQACIAQMELEHAVRGSMDAFAAGMPPAQIFAMHLGMLAEAAQLSGGSMGKLGSFLGGPWGIALTVAVMAIGPLITKLFQAGEGVDALTGKLDKEAKQQALNDQAHKAFSMTLDGVTEALRKNREALNGIMEGERSAAEKALADALAQKARLDLIERSTRALIDQAKAQIEVNNAMAIGPETKTGRADPALAAADAARSRLAALEATLPTAAKNAAEAQSQIDAATAALMAHIAEKDPVELIRDRYKHLTDQAARRASQEAAAARAAGDQAKAQALITTELQKQVVALDMKRDAEIKAYEASHRKGPANAGGTAIFNDQIAAFFDEAVKFRGMSETKDKGVLEAFFREANLTLDPEKTAWCAAFVNAVLANQGVKGTGSLAAKSFLTFGKDDTHSPQRGDIVVVRSNGSASGQHVGFLDSIDKAGNIRLLAGNTGNKVGEETVAARNVLAVRRPPTPSEAAAAGDKAIDEAMKQQDAFDSEASKLQQEYLTALAKVNAGLDAQASTQLAKAQEAHDAEAKHVASDLAEGKYGEATSELAQARARQLQAANDAALKEKQAAINLENTAKQMKSKDDIAAMESGWQLDSLRYQESIARTADQRRQIALDIVDVEFKEKERHLQVLLALDKLLGNTEDAAKVMAELAHLPAEKTQAGQQAANDNRNPLQDLMHSLPQNMTDVRASMQGIGADALKSLNDGLTNALLTSKSLKDLWHNFGDVIHSVAQQILKDLIDLAIKMFIIKPILQLAGVSPGGGFATGTDYAPGGMAWVGEHGPELMSVPKGSRVYSAPESRRIAANDRGIGSVVIPISIDATGADAAGLARVEGALQELKADLPGLVATHWADANERFYFRGQRK